MIEEIARASWGKVPKCDLQSVSVGPCGLGEECTCWTAALANAQAALSVMPSKVTRFEVIDPDGRAYTRYNVEIELSFQDDDRTLKVFVRERGNETSG